MGLRNLTEWNDPIFRKKRHVVDKFGERLWTLLDDMCETFEKVGGYGLWRFTSAFYGEWL